MNISVKETKSGFYAHVQEFHMFFFGKTKEEAIQAATLGALRKLATQHPDIVELAKKYLIVKE